MMKNVFHKIFFVTTLLLTSGMMSYARVSKITQKTSYSSKISSADTTGTFEKVKMPEYPGGFNEMIRFLRNNLKYPEKAIKDSIVGKVVLHFTVSKTGKIKDVNVIKNLTPECDSEAIRVVESMPDWIPGMQKGKNIDVRYTLPIKFSCGNSSRSMHKRLNVLILVDGKKVDEQEFKKIKPETIESVNVIKDKTAIEKYGDLAKGRDGVIVITLKKK